MKKIILFLIAFTLIIQACTTSKSLAKKAKTMEDTGQYKTASELYFQSLRKDANNIEAVAGMKRSGTMVLNEYLSQFSQEKLNENYKAATYTYIDAVAYVNKIKTVKVNLVIPEFTSEDFKNVRSSYLNQEYEAGLKLIEDENFSGAEQKFNEIYKFDQEYKEVKELRNIAYLEPLYRTAETFKDNQDYRKAYYAYQKILARVPNYKNTKENSAYALEKGRVNIMIMNQDKKSKFLMYTNNIKSYTINSIIKANDPFIKIVDRDNMDKILKEQELSVSGLVSQNEAVEVGELAGAQYALQIEVTNFSFKENNLTKTAMRGFEQYSEKVINKETQVTEYRTNYKSVTYYIFKGSRNVSMTTTYKLLSLKTGEIVNSEILEKFESSNVKYLTYSGNINKLYPILDGKVNVTREAHDELVRLSQANKNFETKETLTSNLYKSVSQIISQVTIDKFSK